MDIYGNFVVFSARITWFDEPIHKDFQPGDDSRWAFQRLHDPNDGVFATVINAMGVVPAAHDPMDDFVTEGECALYSSKTIRAWSYLDPGTVVLELAGVKADSIIISEAVRTLMH